jgi:hypothetical protein
MKKNLAIFLFVALSSCANSVSVIDLIHIIGMKESKDETPEEIEEFLRKKKYTFDESVLLIDSLLPLRKTGGYIFANQDEVNDRIAALEIRIFDSTGAYYTSFSQCHGDFNKKNVVSGMPIEKNDQQNYINNSLSLKKELVLFDLNYAQKQTIATLAKNYKYTIVIYYPIWANHFSEKILKELSKFKKRHSNEVYLILANSAMDKISDSSEDTQ